MPSPSISSPLKVRETSDGAVVAVEVYDPWDD